MRIGGDGGSDGDHNDPKASAQDVRRSTAAILQQMATVAAPSASHPGTADPKDVLYAGSQAPNMMATATTKTKTASPDKVASAKRTLKERDVDHEGSIFDRDSFLSVEDLKVLQEAYEIAGVPEDSPDSVLEANDALRRAFLLSRVEGGIGFSSQQTQALMRKVLADRAALSGTGQNAADRAARLASDEADAEAALSEAEATFAKAEEDGDDELLATLMRVKRAKKMVLQKAKEERERELALEVASQAAWESSRPGFNGTASAEAGGAREVVTTLAVLQLPRRWRVVEARENCKVGVFFCSKLGRAGRPFVLQ